MDRDEFMDFVYDELYSDGDNNRANRIIDAADEYAESAQSEIIRCKDCKKHNVSVGYQKDCCPLYEYRGMSYGHEHDYQFCSFAERRTDGKDSD